MTIPYVAVRQIHHERTQTYCEHENEDDALDDDPGIVVDETSPSIQEVGKWILKALLAQATLKDSAKQRS